MVEAAATGGQAVVGECPAAAAAAAASWDTDRVAIEGQAMNGVSAGAVGPGLADRQA